MGNKIITGKDFWMCSSGAVPAQLQGTRKSNKTKEGDVYITVADTATSSWIDFGCTKNMFMDALIAAVAVVVVVALIVATGGAAAIGLVGMMAIGAGAAVIGGTVSAIEGALKCGQDNAGRRHWDTSKSNMILTGTPAITSGCSMICDVGGEIKHAPEIKSWTGAVLLGGFNYLTKLAECALGGMMVGLAGALSTGSVSIIAPTKASIVANFVGGFHGIWGGTRVMFGLNALSNKYAYGEVDGVVDGALIAGDGAIPEVGMLQRIFTGQAEPTDAMILLYLLNLKVNSGKPTRESAGDKDGQPAKNEEGNTTGDKDGQPAKNEEGNTTGDKDGQSVNKVNEESQAKGEKTKDGNAYEENISSKRKGEIGEAKVIEDLKAQGYTDVVQVQNNSGHGVDIIARNPITNEVKCIEAKTNSSPLSEAQNLGGKKFVQDRLDRAVSGKGHYKIPPNPPEVKTNAQKAKDWIQDANKVDYEVHRIKVDNVTGQTGTTTVTKWDAKP